MKRYPLPLAALALGACQVHQPAQPVAPAQLALNVPGHEYAKAACGTCHAVEAGASSSPNPNAPPFSAIVNKEGLTKETLLVWLRDAHNYPDEMQFQVGPSEVDTLVTYMLSLSDPEYRPAS
ncbi:MAG: c-type cytochrome [Sphingomicrobium sp.]